jgi:hypothetical protein
MKQLLNYFCIFALCLSFSAVADSEGDSSEINAHLEAIEAHKKTYNNFEFCDFLSDDERSSMKTSLSTAKKVRAAIDNIINIKDDSEISIVQLGNEMIEIESTIDSGITDKASLLGRFHSAKSEGLFNGDIAAYLNTLSKLKSDIEEEVASGSFEVTKANIFFNKFDENENDKKSVDLNEISLSDLASVYNYYKSSKGLSSSAEVTRELASASQNTEAIMIMNNN